MTDSESTAINALARSLGRKWPMIATAETTAAEVRSVIADALGSGLKRVDSDVDVVVFGSLARGEWTSGSDVDWTLLVDGQANPEHQQLARAISRLLAETRFRGQPLPSPGNSGIFGTMAFSHDMIHRIGGDADSNSFTTRRILMLLESSAVRINGDTGPRAYERTLSGIVDRYLRDDANVSGPKSESRIPRFLLNDIVRYWRTMCVDFAWKGWEQGGEKWALRNIKLRISRKLLFASGMLTIFSCQLADVEEGDQLARHLTESMRKSPLEILATVLPQLELDEEAGQLLDCYNEFLTILNDPEIRGKLAGLTADNAYQEEMFLNLRDLSHRFQDALSEVFFEKATALRDFNKQYGVF